MSDDKARLWYMNEASLNQWDYRTLKRNIDSQYFYRLMQTSDGKKNEVKFEMEKLTQNYQNNKLEYLTYLPTKEQLKLEIEKQKEIMEIKSDSSEL